ncbi:MAG: hypothetical protein CM1200mP35_08250 [Chloroflexota bacterium]|nr:MAG: hypothetical protein CM1200mP35_08250 [Chloroflexota bacterium]
MVSEPAVKPKFINLAAENSQRAALPAEMV